ncbi:thioesterase family protein [Rhodococcus sp. ABRD24]|uniref:acyl-CoA thioesterase n=1 Tax=Rhodococcus sp. ABRD24 TaxID=2507582 RepID=UPI00103D0A76|nr:thioesterase family protein [Rhodococcus sp. ABRD24]QBJ95853.1 thioesterase family protein [Rhodococcus sp. ABRD24]
MTTTLTPFPGHFDDTWRAFDGIHGGLVLAAMLRAAAVETDAVPVAATAHFYAPVRPGPIAATVRPGHGGRSPGVQVDLDSAATALVRLSRNIAPAVHAPMSDAADNPEKLPALDIPVDFVPFSQHLDIRPINSARPFAGGAEPEFDVWIRLLPTLEFTGVERAAILLDALPPGLFATRTMPVPIPTTEITAHFAPAVHTSAGPWHRLRHRTVWWTPDLCVDETELFTSSGELAAQARQLRRILDH